MPQVNVACPSTGAQKQIKVDEDSKVSEAACARDQRTRERHKSWDLFFFFFFGRLADPNPPTPTLVVFFFLLIS